jgi:hypothetical protein
MKEESELYSSIARGIRKPVEWEHFPGLEICRHFTFPEQNNFQQGMSNDEVFSSPPL